MIWAARLLSLAIGAALGDAAIASVGTSTTALVATIAGTLFALAATAATWRAPWIGTALSALALETAFAIGTLGGAALGPHVTQVDSANSAALVAIFGLVVAAVVALVAFRSTVVRVGVLVALGYGIVTFGAAVGHGGLATAFRTSPLAWTGGPYLAVEILLPLSALVALGLGLRLIATKRGSAGAAAFVAAFALFASTQLGAYAAGAQGLPTLTAFEGHLAIAGFASGASGGGDAAFGPFDAETGAAFVPNGSGSLSPEVAAASKTIASDPASALTAVASLADDLYPGALGGAVGALRSGAGNSIDKALLLRDVLRANAPAIATAFAQCTLSDSDADAFVASMRAAGKAHPKIVLQSASDAATSASDAAVRTTLTRWGAAWKSLVATTQSDGAKLGSALQSANVVVPAGLAAPERLRRLAADHFWLRANVNGTWLDLDPTIDRAAPGKTRCTASSTSNDLPADRYDVLGIRVVEETAAPARRTIILDRTMRTVDIADRDVSLMFAETVGLEDAIGAHDAAPTGASRFTPLLHVGAENVVGTSVLLPTLAPGKALGSTLASALGDALATPTPTPNVVDATASPVALPIVTAIWKELSVSAPGSTSVTARSAIFDRLGYAARLARAPIPSALSVKPDDQDYRAMQTIWNLVVTAGSMTSGAGPSDAPSGYDAVAVSANLARLNASYTGVRRALTDDARNASIATAAMPGISIVAMTNDGAAMDVASDTTLPLTGDDARPLWASASLLAERALIGSAELISTGGTPSNVDALTLVEKAPPGSLVATKATAASLASNGDGNGNGDASADARARAAAHVASGDTVVALSVPASVSSAQSFSWIVSGTDGTIRDEDASGRHAELTEEGVQTNEVAIKNVSTWRKFTCTIMPVVRAAVFALSVAHNGSPFSPAGAAGLGAGQRAATQAAVDAAQAGQDQPVACGGA